MTFLRFRDDILPEHIRERFCEIHQHIHAVRLTLVYICGSLEHKYSTEDIEPKTKPIISFVSKG